MKSESQDENTIATPAENREGEPRPAHQLRVVGTAISCLLVFALGMYVMQTFSAGAIVIVEADEVASVLVQTGGLRLEEVDGPLVLTLRQGRNAVRAGSFHVVGDIEGARLSFSTGRRLEISKDEVVTMRIESVADAFPSD